MCKFYNDFSRIAASCFAAAALCGATLTGSNLPESPTQPAAAAELPLPPVPAELRSPRERADFIVVHFWDNLQPADTALTRNPAWMEQNFANFASVFPHASIGAVSEAVRSLETRMSQDSISYRQLLDIGERYLYEPDSPVFFEEAYIPLIEAALQRSPSGDANATRYRFQLMELKKNRLGSVATDFQMTLADGSTTTLHQEASKADLSLLMLYDPECDHCTETIDLLSHDAGGLNIIAVYFEGDGATWDTAREIIPAGWVSAYTPGNPLEEGELYSIRRLPTLYLIDSKSVVIAKDITGTEVARYRQNADKTR